MIVTNWEAGTTCCECRDPIELGQDMLYGRCMPCGRLAAQARNAVPASPQNALEFAREAIGQPGRIVLTRRQLRSLIELACSGEGFRPVRRPDRRSSAPWYGRVPGWDAARVARGLSPQETVGLWLDYLDTGRIPPVCKSDLERLLGRIGGLTVASCQSPGKEQDSTVGGRPGNDRSSTPG